MCSLAAARADNFYNPPDWDPRRHLGRDKFQGSKGKNQYEEKGVIRFELMYDSWCLGCDRPCGRGTRYNAFKIRHGKYFSTTIWEFQMKCASCPTKFIIRTDPKNCDYEFVSGIKRMAKTILPKDKANASGLDMHGAGGGGKAGARMMTSQATRAKIAADPCFRVEHVQEDKRRAASAAENIEQLFTLSKKRRKDDYGANYNLRKKFRKGKKTRAKLTEEGRRAGLPFALLAATAQDAAAASRVRFRNPDKSRIKRAQKRMRIRAGSIFGGKSSSHSKGLRFAKIHAKALKRRINPKHFRRT